MVFLFLLLSILDNRILHSGFGNSCPITYLFRFSKYLFMKRYFILPLIAVILVSGCTTQPAGNGLSFSLTPDPGTVLDGSISKVHLDISNDANKRLYNVNVDIFSPGLMTPIDSESCKSSGALGTLLPGEFRSYSCDYRAPSINQDRSSTTLNAKATYQADFSAVQPIEMYSEAEYNNRLATSGINYAPQSYSYSDGNIALQVDFTDPLPLVAKAGRKLFVKFSLRNIGSGLMGPISPSDVSINQVSVSGDQNSPALLLAVINTQGQPETCHLQETLYPTGKTYPSFSCQILMPANMNVIENFDFTFNVRYSYDIRTSANVDIIR